eukprot:gene27911-1555_t
MADEPPAQAGGAAAAPLPLPPPGLQKRLERSLGQGVPLPPSAPWGDLLRRQSEGAQLDAPQGRPVAAERYAIGGQQNAAVVVGKGT